MAPSLIAEGEDHQEVNRIHIDEMTLARALVFSLAKSLDLREPEKRSDSLGCADVRTHTPLEVITQHEDGTLRGSLGTTRRFRSLELDGAEHGAGEALSVNVVGRMAMSPRSSRS